MRLQKSIALSCAAAVTAVVAVTGYSQRAMWTTQSEAKMSAQLQQPLATAQLWHCGMHPQVMQDHPGFCPICHMALTPMSASHDTTHAGSGITIDPVVVQNMGVRTATAVRGAVTISVQTVGTLTVPEPAIFDIVTQTNGWITQLNANTEGMHVQKGDLLFKYYSPDVHQAEAELIQAMKVFNLTKSDWVTTRRRAAQLDVDAARRKCAGLGLDDSEIDLVAIGLTIPATNSVRSSVSGAISQKTVVQGSSIWSGMKIMRVEEHAQLWLNAEVFEDQMALVSMGDQISATFDALPEKFFTGRVAFVYPHVEAMSRTEMVRIVFDNPEQTLKPGMDATVVIHARSATDTVLVPREAVIDTGMRQMAFVAQPGGHFEARQVRVGAAGDDDLLQIFSGIAEGESVVISGQFLLDVESRTQEAIDKMRDGNIGDAQPEMIHPTGEKGGMP